LSTSKCLPEIKRIVCGYTLIRLEVRGKQYVGQCARNVTKKAGIKLSDLNQII